MASEATRALPRHLSSASRRGVEGGSVDGVEGCLVSSVRRLFPLDRAPGGLRRARGDESRRGRGGGVPTGFALRPCRYPGGTPGGTFVQAVFRVPRRGEDRRRSEAARGIGAERAREVRNRSSVAHALVITTTSVGLARCVLRTRPSPPGRPSSRTACRRRPRTPRRPGNRLGRPCWRCCPPRDRPPGRPRQTQSPPHPPG